MSVSDTLTQNVQQWTLVLNRLVGQLSAVTVRAHQTLRLDDDFFDAHDVLEGEWFQLGAKNYDLFLDDGVGTIHLANLSGKVDYVNDDPRLVTWYGHDPKRYKILLTSPDDPHRDPMPTHKTAWFAWRSDSWMLYAHDGKALMPVLSTGELIRELGLDPDSRIWLGWNGTLLDLFTIKPQHLPADLCAVFVDHDQTVGAVHRTNS